MTQYLLSVHMVEGEPLPADDVMAKMYAGTASVASFQRYVPELFRWKTIARRRLDRAGHARLTLRAVRRVRIRAVVRTGGTDIVSGAVRIGRRPPFG